MTSIAIIGFGTVGRSVFDIIEKKSSRLDKQLLSLKVKYILDEKEITEPHFIKYVTKDFQEILKDKAIDIVVETTNCVDAAYYYVKSLLLNNIKVVTSNKELVSLHGAELTGLALEYNTAFLFDASVCGSIPVITNIYQALSVNELSSIYGIMNGTTNFMLTKMAREGVSLEAALSEAQALGYAETNDPSNDTHGIDASRKIGILASLASGREVRAKDMSVEGITKITLGDIKNAANLKGTIRLIAYGKINRDNNTVISGVEPMIVSFNNKLSAIDGVSNGVILKYDMAGEITLCGPGAGGEATASAVICDILHIIKAKENINRILSWDSMGDQPTVIADDEEYNYYIRVENITKDELLRAFDINAAFSDENGTYLVTKKMPAAMVPEFIRDLESLRAHPLIALKCLD